jgi:hypothetical protein
LQILKETSIDWHERKLVSKLYMDLSVKVWLGHQETRSVKVRRGVRQGCCLSPIQWVPYQRSSWSFWGLKNRMTGNLHCEIFRWPCASGWGRNSITRHNS